MSFESNGLSFQLFLRAGSVKLSRGKLARLQLIGWRLQEHSRSEPLEDAANLCRAALSQALRNGRRKIMIEEQRCAIYNVLGQHGPLLGPLYDGVGLCARFPANWSGPFDAEARLCF